MRYQFGECVLDLQDYVLSRAGRVIRLRLKAFTLLHYLLLQAPRAVPKEELYEHVWPQQFLSESTLESTVRTVRQAIGDDGRAQRLIQTVYGYGYRFIGELQHDAAAADPTLAVAMSDGAPGPPLDLAPTPTTPAPAAAFVLEMPAAERRQLTMMWCDLTVSPPATRQGDPEDLYDVIRSYQETCTDIIRQLEGQLVQNRGAVLVVAFGSPQAHDDDAQRAVHAGLRIVNAIGELQPRGAGTPDLRCTVRVGIHTGLVMVGAPSGGEPQTLWALGETPTLAAQMQELAAPNTVVISAATYRLIVGYFRCHELHTPAESGAAPILAYGVARASGMQHRLEVTTARGLTPLVGRKQEIGLLMEHWAQAKEGLGHIVLLTGEAGIGKSRLLQVLQEHVAAEPHTQIVWRGSPYDQHSALHPMIAHLRRLVQRRPDDPPAALLRHLEEALAPYDFVMAEVVPLFAALLSLPLPAHYPPLTLTPQRQRQQTFTAALAWMLAEATRQPVLFIVEDLHWLDPSTLEYLSLLVDQGPTARLFTVFTCRPEFAPPWGSRAHVLPLMLGRLPRPQAEILVQRVAGKALPPQVHHYLVSHSDGVPLFAEELTKTVLESGLLREQEEHYELLGALPPLAIPATLHGSLLARLDRLGPSKTVAQLGATLGRTFSADLLHAVSAMDEVTVQQGLRQLVEAELLYQQGVSWSATYRFKHALIQEAAYQSLLKRTRQQYHGRIAQVLAERFPETVEAQPELLAHHYTEAGLAAAAVPYWQRAGERSVQRSANAEAVKHLSRGLQVLATLPETPSRHHQELALQMPLGSAWIAIGGPSALEVEHTYSRAWALCQQVGETPRLFPTLRSLCAFYRTRGMLPTARTLGEQMLRLAQQTGDPIHLLDAYDSLGTTLFFQGEYAAARLYLESGVALATPVVQQTLTLRSGLSPVVWCRGLAAAALWCLGYPTQAMQQGQASLALAQELAHPHSLAFARQLVAHLHSCRREAPALQIQAEALVHLATAQGFPHYVGVGTWFRGLALARQGQPAVGLEQMQQGLAVFVAMGLRHLLPYKLIEIAQAMGNTGQVEAGLRQLAEAFTVLEECGHGEWLAEAHRLQGELLLRQHTPDAVRAEACFQQALDIARRQQAKSWELRAAVSLSRLWQCQGKRQAAQALLAPLYGWFTEGFDTADLQDAQVLLAQLGG